MIETALPEVYLSLLSEDNLRDTVTKMLKDPDLKHVVYEVEEGRKLIIINAAKSLHTPLEPHHMVAKGIVIGVDPAGNYTLACMPFTKFYNAFEYPAQQDIPKVSLYYKPLIVRKMDGTLISRWVYDGKVYFSTRGRILNFEKNEFWELANKVIERRDYSILLDEYLLYDSTMLFELVGPSNVVLEFHPEDDLVLIGLNALKKDPVDIHSEVSYYALHKALGLNVVEVYDGNSPEQVIEAFDGVREGVVVNYVDGNGNLKYRVKYKQEEYLNLVRAKNQASPQRLYELALERAFKTFEDVEGYMAEAYADSGYLEELVDFYRVEWPDIDKRLTAVRDEAFYVYQHRDTLRSIDNRKDRFFKAKELVGENYAGLAMQIVDGKLGFSELVIKLGKKG